MSSIDYDKIEKLVEARFTGELLATQRCYGRALVVIAIESLIIGGMLAMAYSKKHKNTED